MAGYKKILGQSVAMGTIFGDPLQYANYVAFSDVGTRFDPISWILSNDPDGFPTTDKEYLFYKKEVSEEDPVFAFKVFYNGLGKATIAYKVRASVTDPADYPGGWGSWQPGDVGYVTMDRATGANYEGIDPQHINYEDHWQNGIMFWTADGIYNTTPFTQYDLVGWTLGCNRPLGINQVSEIMTASVKLDEDQTPPRYVVNGGSFYNQFGPHGYTITSPIGLGAPGIWLALSGIGQDIESFEDDIAEDEFEPGDYGYWSSGIDFADLPSIGLMDTGFGMLWAPNPAQCRALAQYLWSDAYTENCKQKNVANLLDNVINFGFVPFNVSELKDTPINVKVGNVDTGIAMPPLSSQYKYFDFGSLNLRECWGYALDFEPYTTAQLYLPYIGVVDVSMSDLYNGARANLQYSVDLLSGAVIAQLKIFQNHVGQNCKDVLYEFSGNCMTHFPLTGANYTAMYQEKYNNAMSFVSAGMNFLTGNVAGGIGGLVDAIGGTMSTQMFPPAVQLQRSGSYDGATANLAGGKAYIILSQPRQHYPGLMYDKTKGWCSYKAFKLSELNGQGFTKVHSMLDNTVPATDVEKKMIEDLLKEGVIL